MAPLFKYWTICWKETRFIKIRLYFHIIQFYPLTINVLPLIRVFDPGTHWIFEISIYFRMVTVKFTIAHAYVKRFPCQSRGCDGVIIPNSNILPSGTEHSVTRAVQNNRWFASKAFISALRKLFSNFIFELHNTLFFNSLRASYRRSSWSECEIFEAGVYFRIWNLLAWIRV